MQISEDITVSHGTMSQVTTTWAVTKGIKNTRKDTKSNEQDDVDYISGLHVNFHIRLCYSNIT